MYVLAYPTLISAATGYVNPSTRRYRMPDQSLIAADSEELRHCLLLENGSAVGLSDGYLVPGPSDKELRQVEDQLDESKAAYSLFYTFVLGQYFQTTNSSLPALICNVLQRTLLIPHIIRLRI